MKSILEQTLLMLLSAPLANAQTPLFGELHRMLPADSDADDTEALALGDVDGDGDLDALIGNQSDRHGSVQNNLYLNDGTGIYTDVTATYMPAITDRTYALVLGDVDGDRDLDALIGNEGQNLLLLNDDRPFFGLDGPTASAAGLTRRSAARNGRGGRKRGFNL